MNTIRLGDLLFMMARLALTSVMVYATWLFDPNVAIGWFVLLGMTISWERFKRRRRAEELHKFMQLIGAGAKVERIFLSAEDQRLHDESEGKQ